MYTYITFNMEEGIPHAPCGESGQSCGEDVNRSNRWKVICMANRIKMPNNSNFHFPPKKLKKKWVSMNLGSSNT